MSVTVQEYAAGQRGVWDAFVADHRHGSPFHLIAWKDTLESIFNYSPRYLIALEGERICGLLPLFLVENFMIGKVLLSTPFAVYGGILAESPEALQALSDRARAIAEELAVEHLELRNAWPEQCTGFPQIDRYVTFTQAVSPVDGEALLASIPKKTRNLVRKALKNPYSIRPAADLKHFYRLLSNNYRRLGTPVFPQRFFATILAKFGALVDVREVVLEGRVVAASMNFLFRGEMHTYYAASDLDYLALSPNNFLYFEQLLWAGNNGFELFDFGRSKLDTGTFEFKRHWNTNMRPLPYEVHLVKRKGLPNFSPKNPKFDLAIKIWRRVPLPITRLAGPSLVKLFP